MKRNLWWILLVVALLLGWGAYRRDRAARAEAELWAEATDAIN